MRLRTLLDLTLFEYGVLLLAAPLLASVRLVLWLLPSGIIVRALKRFEGAKPIGSPESSAVLPTVVWAVGAVARRVPRATCLTQAIAARMLLLWFGCDARLCLGVAHTDDGSFRAHAWLEREGRPILGGAGVRRLTRLPLLSDEAHIPVLPSLTR